MRVIFKRTLYNYVREIVKILSRGIILRTHHVLRSWIILKNHTTHTLCTIYLRKLGDFFISQSNSRILQGGNFVQGKFLKISNGSRTYSRSFHKNDTITEMFLFFYLMSFFTYYQSWGLSVIFREFLHMHKYFFHTQSGFFRTVEISGKDSKWKSSDRQRVQSKLLLSKWKLSRKYRNGLFFTPFFVFYEFHMTFFSNKGKIINK